MTTDLADPPVEEQYKLCPTCRYATLATRDRCHHCLNEVVNAEILHPDAAQRRLQRQAEIEVEIAERERRRRQIRRIVTATVIVVVVAWIGWRGYRTFIWEPPPVSLPSSSARQMAPALDAWPTTGGDEAATRATAAAARIDRNEAWRADLGAELVTRLIADGDRIYATLRDDRLVAIDVESGTVAWERTLPVAPIGAPTVAGDRVYVPLRAGQLLALQAATGEEIFSSLNTKARFQSSPVIVDGTAFLFGVGNLVAFDAENGEILWMREIDSTWATESPVVTEGSVALASGNRSLVYDRVTSGETYFYEFARAHPYSIATADGIVYTASTRVITAYDIRSRRPWWEGMRAIWFQFEIWEMAPAVPRPPAIWTVRRPPEDGFPMAVSADFLHLANDDGDLRAYSRVSGEVIWAIETDPIVAPPLLTADGLLIAHEDRLAIYDLATGEAIEERALDSDQFDDVIVTSAGTFIATNSGELIALR